jgi:hypothetical protein
MELYQCLPCSTVKILKQVEPEPYSGYKRGDQIDLEAMISQIEWESGIRQEWHIQTAPETHPVFEGDLIFYEYLDGMYAIGHKLDPNTMEKLEPVKIGAWTQVEFIEV